jgi:hypothetical protein
MRRGRWWGLQYFERKLKELEERAKEKVKKDERGDTTANSRSGATVGADGYNDADPTEWGR